jgi:hypothetical protein
MINLITAELFLAIRVKTGRSSQKLFWGGGSCVAPKNQF